MQSVATKPIAVNEPPVSKFESELLSREIPRPSAIPIQRTDQTPDPVAEKSAEPEPVEAKIQTREEPPVEPTPKLASWVIQVASFASKRNATKLAKKLRAAGLDTVEPQQIDVDGKTMYRVKVGPEIDKGRAEKLLPKIKQISGLTGKVIQYP
jgi:DedD protein